MGYPIGCVQGIHHTISDVSDARLTDIHFIQTITSQATRDDSISQLLSNMDEVDMFLTENDLAALTSMKSVVVRICQQTLECSYFLRDYSKSQNFYELNSNVRSSFSSHKSYISGIRPGKMSYRRLMAE